MYSLAISVLGGKCRALMVFEDMATPARILTPEIVCYVTIQVTTKEISEFQKQIAKTYGLHS
jgi:hypothetical protein